MILDKLPGEDLNEICYYATKLVKFVLDHRSRTSFEGRTKEQIFVEIFECNTNKTLFYSCENIYTINGIACFSIDQLTKTIWVHDVLTSKKGVTKEMVQFAIKHYEGFSIKGKHRTGRTRNFNSIELNKKLYGK